MGLLDQQQIIDMGFASIGSDVRLSDKASYYNCENIWLGNNVRIDDFCVLSAGSGGIMVGNHVHIAVYSSIIGGGKVILEDFSNLSSRVSIYSSSDDYSGNALTNPTIPEEFTNVVHKNVTISRHVIIGTGSVILPGVTLEEGVAIGALSLVKKDCQSFGIYVGVPVKRIRDRQRDLLKLESKFINSKTDL